MLSAGENNVRGQMGKVELSVGTTANSYNSGVRIEGSVAISDEAPWETRLGLAHNSTYMEQSGNNFSVEAPLVSIQSRRYLSMSNEMTGMIGASLGAGPAFVTNLTPPENYGVVDYHMSPPPYCFPESLDEECFYPIDDEPTYAPAESQKYIMLVEARVYAGAAISTANNLAAVFGILGFGKQCLINEIGGAATAICPTTLDLQVGLRF